MGITAAKPAAVAGLKSVRRAGTVLVCDVDEFLAVHVGHGRLANLLAAPGRGFPGLSITWRCIGSGGIGSDAGVPMHQQFTVATWAKRPLNRFVKSLYRHPRWFGRIAEHGPGDGGVAAARRLTASGDRGAD